MRRAHYVPTLASSALTPVKCEFVPERASSRERECEDDASIVDVVRALDGSRRALVERANATCERYEEKCASYVRSLSEACAVMRVKSEENEATRGANALRWTSSAGANGLRAYDGVCGLFGERVMAVCAHAAALRAIGVETTCAVTSARALRSAAGAYRWASERGTPPLRSALGVERAIELTSEFSNVMRLLSLADAQSAGCRLAREKWDGVSGAYAHWRLMTKLYASAMHFYRDADAQLNSTGERFCLMILAAVLVGRKTHECEAWLALSETLKVEERFGDVVISNEKACRALDACERASRELAVWSEYYDELRERANKALASARRDNEFVYFQKATPDGVELPATGVVLAVEIPYEASLDTVKHSFLAA